jgi:hypothetical protein
VRMSGALPAELQATFVRRTGLAPVLGASQTPVPSCLHHLLPPNGTSGSRTRTSPLDRRMLSPLSYGPSCGDMDLEGFEPSPSRLSVDNPRPAARSREGADDSIDKDVFLALYQLSYRPNAGRKSVPSRNRRSARRTQRRVPSRGVAFLLLEPVRRRPTTNRGSYDY